MELEDRTIVSVPATSVSIVTIANIQKRRDYYELVFGNADESLSVSLSGKDFAEGLQRGDKVFIFMQGNRCAGLYGPLEKGRLYAFRG